MIYTPKNNLANPTGVAWLCAFAVAFLLGSGFQIAGPWVVLITTKSFRLFWGWVFHYISCLHTAYIGEDSYLHFRYLKCLVKQPSFGVFSGPLVRGRDNSHQSSLNQNYIYGKMYLESFRARSVLREANFWYIFHCQMKEHGYCKVLPSLKLT